MTRKILLILTQQDARIVMMKSSIVTLLEIRDTTDLKRGAITGFFANGCRKNAVNAAGAGVSVIGMKTIYHFNV